MKRFLAVICILIMAAAFVTICLSLIINLNGSIPVVLFVIGIGLFLVVKRMPDEEPSQNADDEVIDEK